jgi:putative membrane protein
MWWWHDGWGWGGWVAMSLSMLVFWGLAAWVVVTLLRGNAHRPGPERILADRLARGEIDEEEYRRRLQALRAESSRSS